MKTKLSPKDVLFRFCFSFFFLFFYIFPMSVCLAEEQDGRIVVTADDIKKMQAIRVSDVLNQVPGVNAGDTSVSIHGSYKVKVFVDNRPINDPTSSHGGVRWDLVSLENVEKIEILRGKGAIRYGNDAGGGVILITTRKISELSGNVNTYGGNYGTGSISANSRIVKEGFGGAVSAAYDITDGYAENNDKTIWRGGLKTEYALAGENSVTVTADHAEDDRGYNGTRKYPTPFSRGESTMTSFSLLSKICGFNTKTYYNDGWKHNTDTSKNLDNELDVTYAGQEISSGFDMGGWGSLNTGATFEWGKADGDAIDGKEENDISLFAVQSFEIKGLPVSFTAGFRAGFHSEFDDSLNPELKALWRNPFADVSLSYSRSSNTPSFHQRYNETSSTRPNPDLDMETAENYGISFSRKILPELSGSATLFYNEIKDRITYVRDDDGIGQYVNFGKVTYKGGDVSLNWKPFKKFSIKASYTYLEAKDEETGQWVTAKAKHKANAEMYYTPIDRLSLILGVETSSKVYTTSSNSDWVPGYTLLNIRCEYAAMDGVRVFSEIKNAMDKTYYYADDSPAPPLMWILGVGYSF